MKASLTFRDHPKTPIFKAKIPISFFGVPFRSGIETGDFDELCISFGTAFSSGPLLNFCYRPNDSRRPFSLSVRTGVGRHGSPFGSPISMSAELSFVGSNCRPMFLLHFKPRSGDFFFRRSVESPAMSPNGGGAEEKFDWSWNQLLSSAHGVLSDGEMCARTSAPVNGAVLKLGWSLKLPQPVSAEVSGSSSGSGGGWRELPYLVLRKIAIEREEGEEQGKRKRRESRVPRDRGDDVAEERLDATRELDLLKIDQKEDLEVGTWHLAPKI